MTTFDTAREIGLALPDTRESTSYGTPALKVRGKLLARLLEDPDVLVVRTEFEERKALMAEDAQTYFITDHYRNWPWVLVRLSRVDPDTLRDLLRRAWRLVGQSARRREEKGGERRR
jgi:hypothetical protein